MKLFLLVISLSCFILSCGSDTQIHVGIISDKKIRTTSHGGKYYYFVINGKDDDNKHIKGICYVSENVYNEYNIDEIYPHGVSYIEPR